MSQSRRDQRLGDSAAASPRVSLVAATRNDDHGGSLSQRTSLFVDGLARQADTRRVPIELVLVEWNPPPDRPPLAESIGWPRSDFLTARVITVPPEQHRAFDHSTELPLFQMIAKNVGIRRAHAEFVVATNIDILFSDPLFDAMTRALRPRTVYRANRADIVVDYEHDTEAHDLWMRAPVRVHRKDGVYYDGRRLVPVYQGLWDAAALTVKGAAGSALARGRRPQGAGTRSLRLAQAPETGDRTGIARARRLLRAIANQVRLPHLHLNTCGDFTLISRDGWDELGGYSERPMYSWHIDSLLLFQASAKGFAFVDLPPEMFAAHMEHGAGSGWTPEGARALFERLGRVGVPYLDDDQLGRLALKLRTGGNAAGGGGTNSSDWGLAAADLPEATISKPG